MENETAEHGTLSYNINERLMNRYYWIALCLILILLTALSTIWILEPANQDERETMSVLFTVIGTFAAIIFGILGLNESKRSETNVAISIPTPKKEIISEFLNKDNSISHYLSNLEATLDSTSRFIALKTEYEDEDESLVQILQSFEWAKRETQLTITITKHPIDFLDAHNHFQRYVLLGEPGSGKTTCLQYLTLRMISEYREGTSNLLPMYVRLSDWKERRTSALEFLRLTFEKLTGSTSYLANEFEALLARGDLLVILDGLNEMPGRQYYHDEKEVDINSRMNLLNEVSTGDAFRSKQDPRERSLRELALADAVRTKFIVSCRKHEFFGSPKWQEIHVLPMNDDQIMEFIRTYMDEKGHEFQTILRVSPTLMELARNPFFLRSMIRIYSPEISVIENRGQFMDYLCSQLLARERAKGLIFDQKKVMRFISKFAIGMIEKDLVGVPFDIDKKLQKQQNLINVLIGTGLLVARGENKLAFYHQLVQEFFAAYALREDVVTYRLSKMIAHKKWSEVILIWHDISLNRRLYSALIRSLKMRNLPWAKPHTKTLNLLIFDLLIWFAPIYLLTHMVIDVLFGGTLIMPLIINNPSLLSLTLLPILIHYLLLFSLYHQEAIANASYILSRIKNPISIDYLIDAFKVISSGAKRTEIAKALADFGDTALNSLISGLKSSNTNIKIGCIETLGLIRRSEATEPLIAILNQGELKLIGPTAKALGNIGDPKAGMAIADVLKLLRKMNFAISTYNEVMPTLNHLGEMDDITHRRVIQDLRDAASKRPSFQSYFVRPQVIEAIQNFGHADCLSILLDIVYDSDEIDDLRKRAVRALAGIKDMAAVTEIVKIYEELDNLSEVALEALETIKAPECLPELYKLLNNKSGKIRLAAVTSIIIIGDPSSQQILIKKISDDDADVRKEIALGLSMVTTDDSKAALEILIHDSSGPVRRKSLESLDFAFPNTARGLFIELLVEKEYQEKVKVLELLGNYRYPEVRNIILKMCADPDEEIRLQAITSLRKLDANLDHELTYVRKKSRNKLIARLRNYLYEKYLPDYEKLNWQSRVAGASYIERGVWIADKIQKDSELKRRYRPIMIFGAMIMIGLLVVFPPVIAAGLPRGTIFLGKFLWEVKWISSGIVVSALLSLFPKIRDGANVKILRFAYRFVRFIGLMIVIIALMALGFYYWWCSIPTLALIGITLYFLSRERLGKLAQG